MIHGNYLLANVNHVKCTVLVKSLICFGPYGGKTDSIPLSWISMTMYVTCLLESKEQATDPHISTSTYLHIWNYHTRSVYNCLICSCVHICIYIYVIVCVCYAYLLRRLGFGIPEVDYSYPNGEYEYR